MNYKIKNNLVLSFIMLISFNKISSQNLTRKQYITKYSALAIKQMRQYKIPASITLAQGILESNNGNSKLAVKANNHFGIKCHGWEGKKIFEDDDKKNECFRKYKSPLESFKDHSLFLNKYSRYAFLFNYKITDYKSWARGLKKAGYATNKKYPVKSKS
jgi:flagellum-specific peptidoglycan hydrolase FlgJ